MGGNPAVLAITPVACAEQQHGGQRDPAAHGVHDDGAGKVVEFCAESRFQPGLDAEGLVPGDAFEEGIDEADEQESGDQLRMKLGALGNAAGNDGRNGRGESQQKEELGQLEAVFLHQRIDTGEKVDTVGNAVADEKIRYGRHCKIGQNFDQRIDLILLAHGTDFEKGKTGVHGKHHDGAQQNEEDVAARLNCFHETP